MLILLLLWHYSIILNASPTASSSAFYRVYISASTCLHLRFYSGLHIPESFSYAASLNVLPSPLAFALSLILWLQQLGPTSAYNPNRTPISSDYLSHSAFCLVYSTRLLVGNLRNLLGASPSTAQLVRINCPSTVHAIKALPCPFYVLLGGNLAHAACRLMVGEVNPTSCFLHHSSSALTHGFHLTLSIQPRVVEL
eukprot:Gb_25553 [translate_table: standard]